MCLAVPAQLSRCRFGEAIADLHGNKVRVNTMMTPDVQDGDWVLIHAGFALQRLEETEAKEIWTVLKEAVQAVEDAETAEADDAPAQPPEPKAGGK